MYRVMEGVRVLEVAQFTFVPAAGAVLAGWGAEVLKVEHPVSGDSLGDVALGSAACHTHPSPISLVGTARPSSVAALRRNACSSTR